MTNDDAEEAIRDAIREGEATRMEQLNDDPSLTELIVATYRGRQWWMSMLATGFTFLWTALTFLCLYLFFQAETTRAQVGWAAGFVYFGVAVGFVKMWLWLEMQRFNLTREIKRLELRVIDLANRLDAG